MRKLKNGVEIWTGNIPGYGTRGYDWIRIEYDNRLLEMKDHLSTWEAGRAELLLELKWKKKTKVQLVKISKTKKLASPICDHCHKPCSTGATSCVNKTFCDKCRDVIDDYIKEYNKEREIALKKMKEQTEKCIAKRERDQQKELDKHMKGL